MPIRAAVLVVRCSLLTYLFVAGPNSLTLSDDEKLADLVPKLVVYYNAKVSDNSCKYDGISIVPYFYNSEDVLLSLNV